MKTSVCILIAGVLFLLQLASGLDLSGLTSTVVPQPQSVSYNGDVYGIDRRSFSFNATNFSNEILESAFVRYYHVMFRSFSANTRGSSKLNAFNLKDLGTNTIVCNVNVKSQTDLDENMDESYSLDTTTPTVATLTATTVWGALRGLETFSQLVKNGYALTQAKINDFPRFKYRGFMIDTARHFYPVNVIYQHLDTMAYNKLNVLHWHIVDDTSFPFGSEKFPEMWKDGAFSAYHVYTFKDIRSVIAYAYERGIRVIPEFDTPGHVTAGFRALTPPILTECFNMKYKTGPLNPTIEDTYTFIDKFYDEIKSVFTDKYVHIGGDEVIQSCWKSNPTIAKWVSDRNMTYDDLEHVYDNRLLAMLKQKNLSYLVWQEVFTRNGQTIAPDTIVEVWDKDNWQTVVADVVAKGYRTVLSAPYYLNYISYGQDWRDYYAVDPAGFTGGPDAEKQGLLGGVEICMWSEYVDSTNFISRSWPRASVVAERGWSAAAVNSWDDAQARFHEFRCKLLRRGIDAEPIENGSNLTTLAAFLPACEEEWDVKYNVPWL